MNQPNPHVDHVQAVDGETISLHLHDNGHAVHLELTATDPADQIVAGPRLEPATARALGNALVAFADNADRAELAGNAPPSATMRANRPRPTDAELELFVSFYCSGFISGVATLANHNGMPADRAQAIGQHLNAIALNAPAYRHTIGDNLARLWSESDYVPEDGSMDVHLLVTKRGSGS